MNYVLTRDGTIYSGVQMRWNAHCINTIKMGLLWAKITYPRLALLAPNRYEVDLSNEILNIDFGQGAAKILEVKIGSQKKVPADSANLGGIGSNQAESAVIFFDLQL